MRILSVVGARPQFIKAAPVGRALKDAGIEEILVHTGQHYDFEMSQVFFDELAIPAPRHHLGIGSGAHGQQTGAMLAALESVMVAERPDLVLVYGDTNSTLAGSLGAAKLHLPVVHVEAGLRSFNRQMPEEINRVVTDHLSQLLLCPSDSAARNLLREGISAGVIVVGDVMLDVLLGATAAAGAEKGIIGVLGLRPREYLLATVHRAENADDTPRLLDILSALSNAGERVIFPVHPRTRNRISASGFSPSSSLTLIDPVGYVDMVRLERSARMILTDSGGVQKEAYWLGIPCVTLRPETEWTETVDVGWNQLAASSLAMRLAIASFAPPSKRPPLYGDGTAAARIARALAQVH